MEHEQSRTDERPRLMIVVASTRPGRVGGPIGAWIEGVVRRHGGFDVDVVDLAGLTLPLLDEPNHPRLRLYERPHTHAWSERVDAADAVVFVMPEYNHSFTAPLKNAIDYLHHEWRYKPVGFVSYGGIAGGTRAVQALKPVLSVLRMIPIVDGVVIPFVQRHITDERTFMPPEGAEAAAEAMLADITRWVAALRPLRDGDV